MVHHKAVSAGTGSTASTFKRTALVDAEKKDVDQCMVDW